MSTQNMSTIEVIENKTMFGKRDPRKPFKAVLKGETIAYGQSKSDCKANAQANLEEAYIAMQAPLVIRLAKDGTTFCARWIGEKQMEYWIQHPDGSGSGCVGNCETSLQRYMDRIVEDYNAVTEVAA